MTFSCSLLYEVLKNNIILEFLFHNQIHKFSSAKLQLQHYIMADHFSTSHTAKLKVSGVVLENTY